MTNDKYNLLFVQIRNMNWLPKKLQKLLLKFQKYTNKTNTQLLVS